MKFLVWGVSFLACGANLFIPQRSWHWAGTGLGSCYSLPLQLTFTSVLLGPQVSGFLWLKIKLIKGLGLGRARKTLSLKVVEIGDWLPSSWLGWEIVGTYAVILHLILVGWEIVGTYTITFHLILGGLAGRLLGPIPSSCIWSWLGWLGDCWDLPIHLQDPLHLVSLDWGSFLGPTLFSWIAVGWRLLRPTYIFRTHFIWWA